MNMGIVKTVINRSDMVRLAMKTFVVRRRIERLKRMTLQTSRLPKRLTSTTRPYIMMTRTSCMVSCWRLNSIARRMISVLLEAYDMVIIMTVAGVVGDSWGLQRVVMVIVVIMAVVMMTSTHHSHTERQVHWAKK